MDNETTAKEELRKEVNNLKAEKSDLSKQLKFLGQTHTVETKALKKELEGLMAERGKRRKRRFVNFDGMIQTLGAFTSNVQSRHNLEKSTYL